MYGSLMFKFLKRWRTIAKTKNKVEVIRAKADLMRAKNYLNATKLRRKTADITAITKQIDNIEDLRDAVAATMPEKNQVLEILNHPSVQTLINSYFLKKKLGEPIEKSEIIQLIEQLPPDVIAKGKEYLQKNWSK